MMDEQEFEANAAEPIPPSEKMQTPGDWAKELGLLTQANPAVPQVDSFAHWKHSAADALHGWSEHAYHFQTSPFVLTERDYRMALAAAAKFPAVPPHMPALVPAKRGDFTTFIPAKEIA